MENALIHETSPYLLQHAHNPVNWYAWNDESLEKAKSEDKPIIVSIGYSTCHWCHVMERESFEDQSIADIMNEHYVCIKVDREERPDVDQVYMDAVQIMGLRGGWPLNVFLTPEQQPFYGGTYFPPGGWKGLLLNIADVFKTKRDQLEESAVKFTEALNRTSQLNYENAVQKFDASLLDEINSRLIKGFDTQKGGMGAAPKFPMPVIWKYMLQYLSHHHNDSFQQQLHLTLSRMALGGIYDQVGGGFARYSTDGDWFAPHFEKMLYDNGQLLSVYAEAYKQDSKPLYDQIMNQTVDWLEREMTNNDGAFYSALDADSEGVEGKFYVWTQNELKTILGDDFEFAKDYYNTSNSGNWEHGTNILHKNIDDEQLAHDKGLDISVITSKAEKLNEVLLKERSTRIRPGLDNKILTAWNALMSKGLLDAYDATGNTRYLDIAEKNLKFLLSELIDGDIVYHLHGKKDFGYLDDYALVIEVLIAAYQVTFDESYIQKAESLTRVCMSDYFDEKDGFFFYTSRKSKRLIADKKELHDNVIPASNSIMCLNLIFLGTILDNSEYMNLARDMVAKQLPITQREPRFMTNWAVALDLLIHPPYEVVIVGKIAKELRRDLTKRMLPNYILMGTESHSDLPLMADKEALNGNTTIYVCQNKTCQLPVHSVDEAAAQMI